MTHGAWKGPFHVWPVRAQPLFWTPYADWIFTVMSTAGIMAVVWLVLRPRP